MLSFCASLAVAPVAYGDTSPDNDVVYEPLGGFEPEVELTSVAIVDVADLLATYDATGGLELPIAGKLLQLTVSEQDLFAPNGREIWEVGPESKRLRSSGTSPPDPSAEPSMARTEAS